MKLYLLDGTNCIVNGDVTPRGVTIELIIYLRIIDSYF